MTETDKEIIDLLRSITPLNKARQKFSEWTACIEQACAQRKPPTSIEIRRMEFEAVKDIINTYNESLYNEEI